MAIELPFFAPCAKSTTRVIIPRKCSIIIIGQKAPAR